MSLDGQLPLILVVDDEEGMRDTLADILEEFDYAVDQAENGLEAVTRVQSREHALVLMDCNMPVMCGLDALREIRALRPTLPIIMMTAYIKADTVDEAERIGVSGVVSKPLNIAKVLSLIEEAIQLVEPVG